MIFVNNNCACSINGKDDEPMKEKLTKRGRATMSSKTWEATSSHTTGEGGPGIRSLPARVFLPPCLLLIEVLPLPCSSLGKKLKSFLQ
jgi:hypothetical protein